MKELYFVSPYSRSMRTIHFQYGYAGKNDYAGKKYILKITSCKTNQLMLHILPPLYNSH